MKSPKPTGPTAMQRARQTRSVRSLAVVVFLLVAPFMAPLVAAAGDNGLVTRASAHSAPVTVDRFIAAVRAAGWVVFTKIDHAAAARAVHMALPFRTVVLFGNPVAGTPAMRDHPTLAIDLPMRVLVWTDDQGRTFITRNTGGDTATRVFARHGMAISPDAQRSTDVLLEGLVRKAVE